MNPSTSHIRAIMLSLSAFTLWVVSDTTMKLLGDYRIPADEIAFFFGICAAVILAGFLFSRGEIRKLKPRKPLPVSLRAALCAGNIFCALAAFPRLPLTSFYVTVFTAPLLIAIASTVFLREHLSLKTAIAILVGFGGVVVALDPAALMASSGSLYGYLAAFVGVVFFVSAQLMLRRMSNTETPECLTFAFMVLLGVAGAVLCAPHFVAMSWQATGIMLVGAVACVVGYLLMADAMRLGPTATVSSFHYSQLITGAIFGYLIWHDKPTWNLVVGAAIIVASGLYVVHQARYRKIVIPPSIEESLT